MESACCTGSMLTIGGAEGGFRSAGTGLTVKKRSLWKEAVGDVRLMDDRGWEFGARVISGEGGFGFGM